MEEKVKMGRPKKEDKKVPLTLYVNRISVVGVLGEDECRNICYQALSLALENKKEDGKEIGG